MPRTLTAHRESITNIDLHCFGDASGRGISAALYAGVSVGLVTAKARLAKQGLSIPRLVEKVIKGCFGCKRFQAAALRNPPPGNLPRNRTEGRSAFQVVGVDFAGPLKYWKIKKSEGKAYIVLYACSLTRGIHLELLPNMETSEFMTSLKRLIAQRG